MSSSHNLNSSPSTSTPSSESESNSRVPPFESKPSTYHTFETGEELDAIFAASKGKDVLVDFSAEWCGPCQAIAPYLKDRALSQDEWIVAKTNCGDDEDLMGHVATAYGVIISAFPLFCVFEAIGQTHVLSKSLSWTGASEEKIDNLLGF